MAEELEKISGIVESVVFCNEENGYTVLDVDVKGEPVTVVGTMSEVGEGDQIQALGHYTSHQSFGPQFKAISCEICLPEGVAAIERYLSSGAVKGVRKTLAKRIVDTFGEDTFDVIENQPELLVDVPGISPKKASEISAEFKKVFGMRTVMTFLARFDLPMSYGVRLWKKYGPISIDLIEENPFVLATDGIGANFSEADRVRADLHIPPYASVRLRAGILSVLRDSQRDGNSCLSKDIAFPRAAQLLNVDALLLEEPLETLIAEESVYAVPFEDEMALYLPDAYKAEQNVASRIMLTLRSNPSLIQDERSAKMALKKIGALEKDLGIEYAELQKKAIMTAMLSPITILTGGPGTGKTTTVRAMIQLLESEGEKVFLAAPTGRAAKRLSELTDKPAKTIHRLLGVAFGEEDSQTFIHNGQNPLKCDVIVVDELSMVDIFLFDNLLDALKMSCKIILVGDSDQLPSVGVGNVLDDLISSEQIPTVILNEVFRQASESLIVTNSHAIIRGEMPNLSAKEGDFFLVKRNTVDGIAKTTVDLSVRRLPEAYGLSSFWDIQVLCPTKKSAIGTVALNKALQESLNPPAPGKTEMKMGDSLFREGDKVMQVRNNYDIVWHREGATSSEEPTGTGIFNGDIGHIQLIDKAGRTLKVQFDNRVANYTFDQLRELELAYAITVHKSQGSEFEAVVLPLSPHGGRMYYRNLLYTAVTRARKLLVVVGTEEAVRSMVQFSETKEKNTHLDDFLRREAGEHV